AADPLNILGEIKPLHHIQETESELMKLRKEIKTLKEHIEKQDQELKTIDIDMCHVLREFQPTIDKMGKSLGFINSSEFLRNILIDELNENAPFFKELIKIFTTTYQETENSLLRDMIFKAQAAVNQRVG
ncbi:MAG: hypothetical protein ACXABG_13385, partial [Promethearchaeota archaeon]